jgi:2-haloacid dehalogenase
MLLCDVACAATLPAMATAATQAAMATLTPKLISFDVFGTLISVRDSSYGAFEKILAEANARDVDVREFWEDWEHRNIAHYWDAYRPYKQICELSLSESFAKYGLDADARLIRHYFEAFPKFFLYDDVVATLERLSARHRIALVSNIDDDLLAMTPLPDCFDLVCTAQAAKGYKPDGALFRHLIEQSGLPLGDLLHCGQSQYTDLVGGKPLGLRIAWINRRAVALDPTVPKPDFVFPGISDICNLVGC